MHYAELLIALILLIIVYLSERISFKTLLMIGLAVLILPPYPL